ncbi:glycosyl hydrolase [Flavisolibacter nicotianae]|uniref:glycosyl hydrolase n=1 Tax=Flavisolibacter nicotianae TaxID=2364882 RepID=UPI000EABE708|nr:glycosyl hydrolase [Flavisolibacter nicotianae]
MKRRTFLSQSTLVTAGYTLFSSVPAFARNILAETNTDDSSDIYQLFKNPSAGYRPFVRWWWNGDKVEKAELARELHLLKEAGIGGVEINPIKFPQRTDDLGKRSLTWLSDEWIEMLQFTFSEAKSLGLTCDLIVGSGWPFGAEYLEGEERAQLMVLGAKKLEGAMDFEASLFDLLKDADPAVTSPFSRRKMEIISVQLAPDPLSRMDEIKDLTDQVKSGFISVTLPQGKYVLYTLVRSSGFLEVINGAPGANGPVLNHYNKAAVSKYLHHMSDAIQKKTGPLSRHIRSFFTDSMELEGANWTADMADEFKKRRGYDLLPYLPFTQFKIGGMGNVWDYSYGAQLGPELKNIIQRVRYDFELTKTELLQERFIDTFTRWCSDNGVKSRAQAYGRGYFPLEGSFDMDIPECETWIKYGIGKEMGESDYRVGRAYTMINKFVSSAAHLKGKRLVSCEELTNTDVVFNATLEVLKVAGDQSAISGVTHPVFHGFNYSPPEAPFPGWVRYGTFINERNNWWPYFRKFTDYKARLSALLQQGEMFADIAILPPVADMWSQFGAQNEPFPSFYYPNYLSLVWEAMHQNGNACDYISEAVIRDGDMKNGNLQFGPRKYHTLFLVQVQSLEPATARKLLQFVQNGGRVFCLETLPEFSLGLHQYEQKDREVQDVVSQLKGYPDRFVLLKKPEKDFLQWYKTIQQQYNLAPYVNFRDPNVFVTQVRYQMPGKEVLLVTNASTEDSHRVEITPSRELANGKQAWIWDAETGERYKCGSSSGITLDLGPADAKLVVFDKTKKGPTWKPAPVRGAATVGLNGNWQVEFRHLNGTTRTLQMNPLKDLKELPDTVSFSGTAVYRTSLELAESGKERFLNLGKVFGVSELLVNGVPCGTRWYGRHIYDVTNQVKPGVNAIEVRVVTTMGNYLKTLKDNLVAQYWTNEKRKDQPIQSMGLVGPVTCYQPSDEKNLSI